MAKVTKKKAFRIFTLLAILLLLIIWGTTKKKVEAATACQPKDLTGEIDPAENVAIFEGKQFIIPEIALKENEYKVLGATDSEKWIEVDLSEQKLKAWEGNKLFLESLVSTGLPWWPTPTGEFKVWSKARATKMEGGSGKYYYYLPNVPYVMFFENSEVPGFKGFSLHGTYWHNDFGRVHSHGCVNLPTPIAEKLFFWTTPDTEGKGFTRSSEGNPGTKIVIHE